MELIQEFENNILSIRILGELDANSSIELDEAISIALELGQTLIAVDMKELDYISSAGLGVFISHLDDVKDKGGQFALHSLSDAIYQTFNILGLHTVLEIVEDKEEAEKLLRDEG